MDDTEGCPIKVMLNLLAEKILAYKMVLSAFYLTGKLQDINNLTQNIMNLQLVPKSILQEYAKNF